MRRSARRDVNHKSIGDHLRALGWSVLDLADHGDGVPDYVVGKPSFACLVECKRPGVKARESLRRQNKRSGTDGTAPTS